MSEPALLDRVRKLLALAGSPNVHEAAAAAARAQALIARHQLEAWLAAETQEVDLDPITTDWDRPLEAARRIRPWKASLAAGLAERHGCLAFTRATRAGEELLLAGRSADRELVQALYPFLVQAITWSSATEGPGRDRAWHDGFRLGAVAAVLERLAEPAEPTEPGLVHAATHAQRAALERYATQELGLKPGRGRPVDARAWARGREVGAQLPLGPPGRSR